MRPAFAILVLLTLGLGSYTALTRSALGERWAGIGATLPDAGADSASGPVVQTIDAAPGGAGPVVATSRVSAYPVTGETASEIFESLVAGGPLDGDRRFFGMTEADMGLQYRTAPTDGSCALVDVRVTLDVVTTLPEWTPPRGVPAALRRDWARFFRALQRHEAEHEALAVRGVEKASEAVRGLRGPSCAAVEAEARRRLQRIEIEIEASHRRYDEQTGHGRTEGAVWPPR